MKKALIPDIVVSRLPQYLQTLQRLNQEGMKTTSSQDLGERIGITAAQIRKDLSLFGEFGKQGTGYEIGFLIKTIQDILKLNRVWDIVVVGAGDLGHAIARYQGFANQGFRIVMIFDNDLQKVGTQIGEFTIQDSREMVAVILKASIKIAMLTVPAVEAQKVADNLVKAGIWAILNYAPIKLNLPDRIQVQSINPIIQLQHMTYYLTA